MANWRGNLIVEARLHAIDDRGAHDGCVGVTRDCRGLVRRFDSEADSDR